MSMSSRLKSEAERRLPLLRQCRKHRLKTKKHKRDGKKKKTKETTKPEELKWELEMEEANKTLYMCILEFRQDWVAYVVRTIKLSDLLSPSPADDPVPLQQVAYEAGSHLPGSVGCGVWGSQIVFTGGVSPISRYGLGSLYDNRTVWHTNVYAFERHSDSKEIRKLDANLQGAKFYPLTVELCGKLYALSYRWVGDIDEAPSFEVFDPEIGKWEGLPQPPFFQIHSSYYAHGNFSYAIAGTKIFACHDRRQCPVFCFDVAHPNREWREVSTMCGGGPFPFRNKALVLDLQGDDDRKIMFAFSYQPWSLLVYLMSLSENQETITKIGEMRMPKLPEELGRPGRCQFVHIGGQKACLVVTETSLPKEVAPQYDKLGRHKAYGAVIPFQFHVDMAKVDKDIKNCLSLQFMHRRTFKYRTNQSTLPTPETVGCFLL